MAQPRITIKLEYLDGVAAYLKAHDKKTKRVLFKLGGYVRKTMRNSMKLKRPGGKSSTAGKPPKYMKGVGPNVRGGIGFTVELKRKTVVIGPDAYDRRTPGGARPRRGGQTVPQILNEGGEVTMPRTTISYSLGAGGFTSFGSKTEYHVLKIKPRPFVDPAHKAGTKKFLELLVTEKLRA